ncbi:hypothetical protein [[Mycoplasma] testudinis]|uniref:hypothetical protein n=1 Tax=[Mycoplasma] testudinis TaxID=33924 RepID=UPI000698EF9E|nr:hypothetical protein [[Mycoplasma] testudinis]
MENIHFKAKNADIIQKQIKNVLSMYEKFNCDVIFNEKEKLKVTITSDYMIFQDGLINGEINMTLEDLAKLMQAGFNKLDSKIEETENRLKKKIEETNTKIEETENRLNTKIEETESRLNTKIEETENRLNTKIEETENRLNKKLDFHETLFKEHGWI